MICGFRTALDRRTDHNDVRSPIVQIPKRNLRILPVEPTTGRPQTPSAVEKLANSLQLRLEYINKLPASVFREPDLQYTQARLADDRCNQKNQQTSQFSGVTARLGVTQKSGLWRKVVSRKIGKVWRVSKQSPQLVREEPTY